jgi:NAD-dependent deacetylase
MTAANTSPAERLAQRFRDSATGRWLIVTGAGISHASGIPTFRGSDPDAIWRRHDVEMATRRTLELDPVAQWSWYLDRFKSLDGALPNPAHRALVTLESIASKGGGRLSLVTQNIDCLHEAAGSSDVIKVHGTSDRLRCSSTSCVLGAPQGSLARDAVDLGPFRAHPEEATLPRCPECSALLRAHVLFFDEFYTEHHDYQFERVQEAVDNCDLLLFIGTSFSVGVTEMALRNALARRIPIVSIDPGSQPKGRGLDAIEHLASTAEEILPQVCQELASDD